MSILGSSGSRLRSVPRSKPRCPCGVSLTSLWHHATAHGVILSMSAQDGGYGMNGEVAYWVSVRCIIFLKNNMCYNYRQPAPALPDAFSQLEPARSVLSPVPELRN